jgi:Flp pilus assembly protein TadD
MVGLAHQRVLTAQALSMNDGTYVLQNYRVQNPSWAHAGRFLSEVTNPSTVEGYYQPLAMISLMLDSAMGGGAPDKLMPYHRTSLVLHAANTVLVIVLLYQLFGNLWAAAMVGLLFGLHPMTVEPVVWLGERKTPLATFFALATLALYVRYSRNPGWKAYPAVAATFVLALMSKPTVTPLPVVMLLLDYWPLKRLSWRAVGEKVPLLVIAGISAVITFLSQRHVELADRQEFTFGEGLLVACHNMFFYPLKIIWPGELSTVYPFPDPMSLSNPLVLGGVVATILLVAALLVSLRWTPILAVGWAVFFVMLAPTLVNVGYAIGVAADKYAYLPALGFLLILGWALSRVWSHPPAKVNARGLRTGLVVVVVVVAGLEVSAANAYLGKWQDTGTYCRHILSVAPEAAWVHNQLGVHLLEKGDVEGAVRHGREAVRLDPRASKSHTNLGLALVGRQDLDEAIDCFQRALQIKGDLAEAHSGLGMAYGMKGQWGPAVTHLEAAREIMPHSPEILFNLGTAHLYAGQYDKAIARLQEVLRYRPNNPAVLQRLAQARALKKQAQ